MRLAEEILAMKVHIKVNSELEYKAVGISIQEWCKRMQYNYLIKNKLMLKYKGHPLRMAGDRVRNDWALEEYESLALEKGINEETITNIRLELLSSAVGKKFLVDQNNGVTPSRDPAPKEF